MKLYSIWLIPDKSTCQWGQRIIDSLVKEYKGVRFSPHITVLGAFEEEENIAISKFQKAAFPCRALELEFDGIGFSTTRFQDVFARIKPCEELMELNISLKELFNRPNDFYTPHMSFMYGHESMKMREAISKSIIIDHLCFTVESIVLAEIGNDIKKFKVVYSIPLKTLEV